ncbi:MAG: DNA-directed RNA polymerase subunit beta', partial [Bacteroidota bacterium]
RSVIVVGPELKLQECGLPKDMAVELFKPFIIRKLIERGLVKTVKSAKKMVDKKGPEVWDILEHIIDGHCVLLNRAPTLHRLGIQAFQPVLVEGKAIRIHPMVCTAFNADFDGDQMAVHVPLSVEAQMESRMLMMSTNNIFSPSSGRSVMTPTQDIALGIYYLTSLSQKDRFHMFRRQEKGKEIEHLPIFNDANEVRLAYADGALRIHDRIRYRNPDINRQTVYGDPKSRVLVTTAGRVLFNEIWANGIGFVNQLINKTMLGSLIWHCHRLSPHQKVVETLDALKEMGFGHATLAGISIGLVDMIVPAEKKTILKATAKQVAAVHEQYRQGVITDGERHNKIVDIWTQATEEVTNFMYRSIEENAGSQECNPVFMMVDSKARGSRAQIRQLAGMRGLMAKPSGEIMERAITANFREGLSVLEYFVSTHGARKGLADTALKTADAGYLTRKLVDVAQDVIIVEEDCNTVNGIEMSAMMEGDEELIKLQARVLGRTTLNDICDPISEDIIVKTGDEIREEACEKIEKVGVERVRIRSVLTCESRYGLCAKCYGRDLATGRPVDVGTAVGIIAAQSIGEPGTQLTLRTFHIGGTASAVFKQPENVVKNEGLVRYHDLRVVQNQEGIHVVLNKNGVITVHDPSGHEVERYTTAIGAQVFVEYGGMIKKDQVLAKWDPYSVPILAEQQGIVSFHDFVENISIKKELDEATGKAGMVVLESKKDLHPQIIIKRAETSEVLGFFSIPAGAHVMVKEGSKVYPGDLLARTPRKESKTRDIVGGLPRVAELFEARQPKDAAEIAKIEGLVDFGPNQRGRRCLVIRDEVTGAIEEHLIPMGKHIVVFKGDRVKKGQQLTEGPIVPQEILEVCGPQELQEYLVNEVQQVYRLQGVEINDKHIEIIVRQMLRKVKITNPGDTDFLWGEQVTRQHFLEVNEAAIGEGKRPAEATPALLGITKASLTTESFISAASFQDTTRVLTEAATLGRVDQLRG